jgi:opacity protein-like surface antigen
MRSILLTAVFAISGLAQPVSIGVTGGVPMTDFLNAAHGDQASYATNTKRYTVGPTIEFHLPGRLSLEVDGLYKRVGYNFVGSDSTGNQLTARTTANSWEFPITGKFEITPGPLRPFIQAGVSVRNISGIRQVQDVVQAGTLNQVTVSSPAEFNTDTDLGFVFGGGVSIKAGRLRISPQIRYTRWGSENFRDPLHSLLHTNLNQADFLLGITF